MARQRLTPERRQALTREALVESATRVFARRGYEAGTLEEIAGAAGFTTGAIYSHFDSKQELFLAVLERRNAKLTDDYAKLLEPLSESPNALSDVAELWKKHELTDRDSLRLMLEFRLAALRDPKIRKPLADFERRNEEAITHFVAERLSDIVGSQELPVPIEEFAVVVHAASQGISQHIAVCSADHSRLFEAFLVLVTRGLTPPTPGPDAPPTGRE